MPSGTSRGGKQAADKKASRGMRDPAQSVSGLSLPALPESLVNPINALRRRRGPVILDVRGHNVEIGTVASGAEGDLGVIRFATSFGAGTLLLPSEVLTAWLREADPEADLASMTPANKALLLEALLGEELDRFEQATNCTVELLEISDQAGKMQASPLAIAWREPDRTRGGHLVLEDASLATAVATILDAAADSASLSAPSVPIPVRVVLGSAQVALTDLEQLEPGDVVLLRGNDQLRSHCVIGAVKAAPVAAADQGWRLTGSFTSLTGSEWDFDMATERNTGLDDMEDAAALSELPITLVFEAGRVAIPLDEVKRLDTGSLIPLAGPKDAVVTILASGKRVGQGELVKLGDGLGVRVLNIFADD